MEVNFSSVSRVSAYFLCVCRASAGPAAALRGPPVVLPGALGLPRRRLAIGWLELVTGPRAAGEEPSAEAASVGRVSTAFDRNAAWTRDIGCFRALRRGDGSQLSAQGEERKKKHPHLCCFYHIKLHQLSVTNAAEEFPRIVSLNGRLQIGTTTKNESGITDQLN